MDIKKFKKEVDLNQQRSLFNECFPEHKGASIEKEKHYLWKFNSFPSQPSSYEYGAYLNKELVGYYAALPYPYIIKGEKVKAGMVCDVMTGVKARGKGVFTKIGIHATKQMKNEGIEFTTGYPIRKEVIPGHIKAGWVIMFKLPLYMKFLSSKSLLNLRKIKFLYPVIDLFLLGYNSLINIFQKNKRYKISIISSTELAKINDFDTFVQKWVDEQGIALNKNTTFLNWRLAAPEKKYKILIARENNIIVGYAVFCNLIKNDLPSVGILDISCLKNYKKLSSTIIAQIQEYAKETKAEVLMMMANKHFSCIHSLIANGFFKSPFKFQLIIKNLSNKYSYSYLKDQKNWHLTWIDSDSL